MNFDIEKFQTDAVNAPTVPAINQLKLKPISVFAIAKLIKMKNTGLMI